MLDDNRDVYEDVELEGNDIADMETDADIDKKAESDSDFGETEEDVGLLPVKSIVERILDSKNPDSYNSRECMYSITGNTEKALQTCREGLNKYPDNIKLLSEAIILSMELGEEELAGGYYERMKNVSFKVWSGNAYSAAMDYLLLHPEENGEEIKNILENCKKNLKYYTRIYSDEYRYYHLIGEEDKGIESLKAAVSSFKNADVEALRLLEIQMDRGQVLEAEKTCMYCLSNSQVRILKKIEQPYILLILALIDDVKLKEKLTSPKRAANMDLEPEFIRIEDEYDKLITDCSSALEPYIDMIKAQKTTLEFLRVRADI